MPRTESRKTKNPNSNSNRSSEPASGHSSHEFRETVESIAVAFILAFLIKGFEAEAFVIPTGSMAPTLYGRHKEVTCPQCGTLYAVNASEEVESIDPTDPRSRWVDWGTCVNCRYQARIDSLPSFKGDRILVMKFLWDLPFLPGATPPQRWDVVVFKYPAQPEQNYIKRLVGLPDEELRIQVGDLLARQRNSSDPFKMLHKPLRHQQAMQMLVYDDTHRPQALTDRPEWNRWVPTTGAAWSEGPNDTFATEASSQEWAALRYRHLVPDAQQWRAIQDGTHLPYPPRPTLITDFYSYNTNLTARSLERGEGIIEPHWVGDLTLEFDLKVSSASGLVRVELVRGGVPYRCQTDVATGQATLYQGDQRLGPAVATPIQGPGDYHLTFANVDGRLTLWVDGQTPFGEGIVYDDGTGPRPEPTAGDLDPVGISARGAAVAVSGLVLKRDIYYTLNPGSSDYASRWSLPYPDPGDPYARDAAISDLLSDPSRFEALGNLGTKEFPIAPGRYMMMGDNSPRSKDGRGWHAGERIWDTSDRADWEVPESLLIGKAFFVYWPHGKPFGPDIRLSRDIRLPFRPYFERMKWIR